MTEFTGERVIPGEVNDDLWAEHAARYAFASRFAAGRKTLDIGCGTGYGVAEFARSAVLAVGVDVAPEAVQYAREHFSTSNTGFLVAPAGSIPFGEASFDLVTAFEVIEHLPDWRALLSEARRVLRRDGVFLVSTPNTLYYAESRAKDGPNPFHVHEFQFAEFRTALEEFFSSVTILLQNRVESFVFSAANGDSDRVESRIDGSAGSPEEAHFFLALCSQQPVDHRAFLYLPRASNLLRERERHIRLLEDELAQANKWLREVTTEHKELMDVHEAQLRHLEEQNRWAIKLEQDSRGAFQRIVQLQEDFKAEQAAGADLAARYQAKVDQLEVELRERTEWALETEQRLSAALAAKCDELAEVVRLLDAAEATVTERTVWAKELNDRLEKTQAQLRMIRDSRWVRLGRAAGIGPQVDA